jgi:hypothetical protein
MPRTRVRTRDRKRKANARKWVGSAWAGLSRETLLETIRELLTWSVAFCAHDERSREEGAFRTAHVLRTHAMLDAVVRKVSEHTAERKRRVREARVAALVPKLLALLEGPPSDPNGKVDSKATAKLIEQMFFSEQVSVMRRVVAALAGLAVSPSDDGRARGARRLSLMAIAKVLQEEKVVNVSPWTLANHRYALEEGTKRREAAAVRGEISMRGLLEARRVESTSMVRFALLALASGGQEEMVNGTADACDFLPTAAAQERKEWF